MPIKIPNELPAVKTLTSENIFVMTETRAITQDIRPLHILLLNLMPTKIDTETQISRLLGNSPLQVELELIHTRSHMSKHADPEHLLAFYKCFDDVKDKNFDGLIITGAPVEHLPFEEVEYWDELCQIMEWSKSHVQSTFHICWGAQAGLYYHYGIPKQSLPEKLFGVFSHRVERKRSILFRGFDDTFMVPHSRHTTVSREDVEKHPELRILASSDEAGIYALATNGGRQIFITGHSEYDPLTLEREYLRDKNEGLPIDVPKNYYPDDDDSKPPMVTWRSHANLLYSNWLNYYVYQTTPYDLSSLKEGKAQTVFDNHYLGEKTMDLKEIAAQLQAGKSKKVVELVQQAIDEGVSAQEILKDGLLSGMDVISEKFKNNEIFIPEVLLAARALSKSTAILKPLLVQDGSTSGKVCIGTVKGDLHDIGKNLCKMMMEGKGLEVIDLGADVDPETFIQTAKEQDCQVICCSALLTTTMNVMADVVKAAEAAGIRDRVKIMVGGAPVTDTFREEIGADGYAPDAAGAAEKAAAFCVNE